MDKQINIEVKDLVPTLKDGCKSIVCGNGDYTVNFIFDEEWTEYNVKTALFVCGGDTYSSVFEGNICKVPELKDGTLCYIGVVSGDFTEDNSNPEKKTSVWCEVRAIPSITSIANEPKAPSKDVYVEFMALLNKYITEGGGGGLTEKQVKVIVAEETADKITEDEAKTLIDEETEGKYMPSVESLSKGMSGGGTMVYRIWGSKPEYRFIQASQTIEGNGVVIRKGNHIIVPEDVNINDPWLQPNVATSFAYVNKVTAPIADHEKRIDANEKRIENLESTLLTFTEDKSSAYIKSVPIGVEPNAILSSIGGHTETSLNALDPAIFGRPVDGNGYITVDIDQISSGVLEIEIPLELPSGNYGIKAFANKIADRTSGGNVVDSSATFTAQLKTVDGFDNIHYVDVVSPTEETVLGVRLTIECTSGYGVNHRVGIMLDNIFGEVPTEYHPYFVGERYAKVTKIISKGSNRFNPQWLIDYDAFAGGLELYGNGLKISDYPETINISFEKFMELTGLKVGDIFSTFFKVKRADGTTPSGKYAFSFDGSFEFITTSTTNIKITDDMLKYITIKIFAEGASASTPIIISDIMVAKGDNVSEYYPYTTEPIDTYEIPSAIRSRPNYGASNYVLDFDTKTFKYNVAGAVPEDVSQYLTDYTDFKYLKVEGGGEIVFENEYKYNVPSEITYVKAKE